MSRLIISEIERKHISSLHNLFLLEQTVEKVKVFKDKGGTYQYAKLPNGTYWYKAGSGAWTQQTKKSGMEAIEKRITERVSVIAAACVLDRKSLNLKHPMTLIIVVKDPNINKIKIAVSILFFLLQKI